MAGQAKCMNKLYNTSYHIKTKSVFVTKQCTDDQLIDEVLIRLGSESEIDGTIGHVRYINILTWARGFRV